MNRNVGATDQRVRVGLGAVLGLGSLGTLAGVLGLPALLAPLLGVFAVVLLVTAATGTCGLYSLVGANTCQRNLEGPQ
jgi:hypothetical protein